MSDAPRIKVTKSGPYEVSEVPLADYDGNSFAGPAPTYLCRCGGSSNKPFCDGTHAKNGFEGTEIADRGPQATRRDTYAGDGVTIHDDRTVCAHAGRCTDGLASVWKLGVEPWIDPHGAPAKDIIEVIEQCPSGALSYSRDDEGGRVEEVEHDPCLVPAPNGPYLVQGHIPVTSSDGEGYENREHVTLCRCGQSENKPFCSGKHWAINFEAGSGPAAD
jgi:CDGSH-type Zn-finger protein